MLGVYHGGFVEEDQLAGSKFLYQQKKSFMKAWRSQNPSKKSMSIDDVKTFLEQPQIARLKFLKITSKTKPSLWKNLKNDDRFDVVTYSGKHNMKKLRKSFSSYFNTRLRPRTASAPRTLNPKKKSAPITKTRTVSLEISDTKGICREIADCKTVAEFDLAIKHSFFFACWMRLQRIFLQEATSSDDMNTHQAFTFRSARAKEWAKNILAEDAMRLRDDLETVYWLVKHVAHKIFKEGEHAGSYTVNTEFKDAFKKSTLFEDFCRMAKVCAVMKRAETLHAQLNERQPKLGKIWCDKADMDKIEGLDANLDGIRFTISPAKEILRRLVLSLPEDLQALEPWMKPALPPGVYSTPFLLKALEAGFILQEEDKHRLGLVKKAPGAALPKCG